MRVCLAQEKNALLEEMSQPAVGREEFVGVRLYTGPMYRKYVAQPSNPLS